MREKMLEIRHLLSTLARGLADGTTEQLLVWVIPDRLACAHRPLRYHPKFGDSRKDLPPEASGAVKDWVIKVRLEGIVAVISLMHPKELAHYKYLDLGANSLLDLYRKNGITVKHLPWDDPAHRPESQKVEFSAERDRICVDALKAYDNLPKPVLLHCSAGIDRSSPVAAYIWEYRT